MNDIRSSEFYPARNSRLLKAARAIVAAVALAMPAALPTFAWADAYDRADLRRIEGRVQDVAERSMPAVVALTHRTKDGVGMSSGTGTIVTPEGLIVTAAHVVAGAETVDVTFPDGTTRTAKVLGADAGRDVALAKVNEPGPYAFVKLGRSKDLKVGDAVVALGHSGGYDQKRRPPVRYGRVFALNSNNGFIRTDCTLVGGDSGGPTFDLAGNLVGVHSNVGMDLSVNHDAPIEVVRDGWDRMLAGERWGKPLRDGMPPMPKLAPAELAGLDADKFRQKLFAAIGPNGQLKAEPATLSKWLVECGMDEARVKAMSPEQVGAFIGKLLGGAAEVKPELGVKPSDGPPAAPGQAGLDEKKFRGRLSGGKAVSAAEAREWLRADGMAAEKLAATGDFELGRLVERLSRGPGRATPPSTRPTAPPATKGPAVADLPPGLDVEKFKGRVMAEAMRSGGKLQVTPQVIGKWLTESGVAADKVAAMSPAELAGVVQKVLGGAAAVGAGGPQAIPAEAKVIVDQDRAVLKTIGEDLKRVAPSVVAMTDGDKLLSLGTIVRADGFVLTKRSEIAKAKTGLRAKLADGRSVSAKQVATFPKHDLALVKVEADKLTPVAFEVTGPRPDPSIAMRPGSFVFAAAPSTADPMLAGGVVSVPGRSLKDEGGYLGIGLTEADGKVKCGQVQPNGPAAKAGLKKDDVIVSLDGKPVSKAAELSGRVRATAAGKTVRVAYKRGDEAEKVVEVELGDRSKLPTPKDGKDRGQPGTVVSDVRGGFPLILQHDLPIKAEECGGPILDLDGSVVGLNVARAGRVDSYAIPAPTVAALLRTVDFEKVGREGK